VEGCKMKALSPRIRCSRTTMWSCPSADSPTGYGPSSTGISATRLGSKSTFSARRGSEHPEGSLRVRILSARD